MGRCFKVNDLGYCTDSVLLRHEKGLTSNTGSTTPNRTKENDVSQLLEMVEMLELVDRFGKLLKNDFFLSVFYQRLIKKSESLCIV